MKNPFIVFKLVLVQRCFIATMAVLLSAGCSHFVPAAKVAPASPYAQWSRGPSSDPGYFPIAVWMQDPALAARYKEAGINTYVALRPGLTDERLAALKRVGMSVICDQTAFGLSHLDDPTIIGWMHGDEPDIEQSLGEGKGVIPPVLPSKIVAEYETMRAADPSRPVLLNVSGGVALDHLIERGVRRGHMEDYPQYFKGCDIASFDIYPVSCLRPEDTGKLWLVATGVERMMRWTDSRQAVWNCLECTTINNTNRKPTPHEVRCEAWMAIIHGSRGFIWFVHEFKPVLREAALLEDSEMLAAVTAINRQVHDLARVINSPALINAASVKSANAAVPVAFTARRHDGAVYLFAVNMRDEPTQATVQVKGRSANADVEVIGENRSIPLSGGAFVDQFNSWDVHLYRIPEGATR